MKIGHRIMDIVDGWKMRGFQVDAVYLGRHEFCELEDEVHFHLWAGGKPSGEPMKYTWNGMEIIEVRQSNHLGIAPRPR